MLRVVEQPENVRDEPRLLSCDARRPAGLTQVLAWKSGRHEIARRQRLKGRDVGVEWHFRLAVFQDRSGVPVDLGEENRLMSGAVEAELDAANPREEPDDA